MVEVVENVDALGQERFACDVVCRLDLQTVEA
jgi:hypothetical protein